MVNRIRNIKFLLASLNIQTSSKDCSDSCIKFLFRLCFLSLMVNFSRIHSWPAFGTIVKITGGFRNNFYSYRVAIGELERASWIGLLEGFLQFVSDFIEAIRIFILNVLHKKTAKNFENRQRSHKKYCFDLQYLQKNISSRETILNLKKEEK